jgi:1,4-alpha-glucan branching enzyme
MPKQKKSETPVTFVFENDSEARQVFLAGDFNAWDPTDTRMVKRSGTFRKKVALPPGEHQYKLVVDGAWQTDPSAIMQIHNGMGSMNSVIRV